VGREGTVGKERRYSGEERFLLKTKFSLTAGGAKTERTRLRVKKRRLGGLDHGNTDSKN